MLRLMVPAATRTIAHKDPAEVSAEIVRSLRDGALAHLEGSNACRRAVTGVPSTSTMRASQRCLLFLAAAHSFSAPPRRLAPRPRTALSIAAAVDPSAVPTLALSDLSSIAAFQEQHTFLEGLLVTLVVRAIILEVRRRVEKPVLDAAGERVGKALRPAAAEVGAGDWAKLVACVVLDLAGDASELLPGLGELTDIAYAPVEAGLLKALFQSNAISAFGFVEEILPFTDIIPTFTLSWCLATLWPTTPLAKKLLPQGTSDKKK